MNRMRCACGGSSVELSALGVDDLSAFAVMAGLARTRNRPRALSSADK
jgi:hypothetical protein